MAGTFFFESDRIDTSFFLPWTVFSTGDTTGLVNDPTQFSSISFAQQIDPADDRDILAVAIHAGQTATFDIDPHNVNANADTSLWLIDRFGGLVASNLQGPSGDPGSGAFGGDPLLTYTAQATGV